MNEVATTRKIISTKEVECQGVNMLACKTDDGKIWVSVASICNGLGVDICGQIQRINRDDILPVGACKMHAPTSSGNIEKCNMLELSFLPMFLTGIKTSKVKPELQKRIIDFKLKAKDVLAKAFINTTPKNIEDHIIQMHESMILMAKSNKEIKGRLNEVEQKADLAINLAGDLEKKIDLVIPKTRQITSADDIPNITPSDRKHLTALIYRFSQEKDIPIEDAWHAFDRAYYYAYSQRIKSRITWYKKRNNLRSLTRPAYLEIVGDLPKAIRVAEQMIESSLI